MTAILKKERWRRFWKLDVMATESDGIVMTTDIELPCRKTEKVIMRATRVFWRRNICWKQLDFACECGVVRKQLGCGRYDLRSSPLQSKVFSVPVHRDDWSVSKWAAIIRFNVLRLLQDLIQKSTCPLPMVMLSVLSSEPVIRKRLSCPTFRVRVFPSAGWLSWISVKQVG